MPARKHVPLLVLLLLAACGGDSPEKGKDGEDERPTDPRILVDAVAVATGDIADHLVSSSTVESEFQVDVSPETSGLVTRVMVEEGDVVRRGQALATIENPNLGAALERARNELDRAGRAYDEAMRLSTSGAVSVSSVKDASFALDVARTTYDEARKTAAFATLVSPVAGTVALRDLRQGETINAGRRAFQIVDLARLRVIVQLPERDLARVHEGQLTTLVPTYDPTLQVPGRVSRISPVVDPSSGTFRVTVVPEDQAQTLRPGQFVSVLIQVDMHEGVQVVPRSAIVFEQGEPLVFRVEEGKPDEEKEGEEEKDEESGFKAMIAKIKSKFPGGDKEEEKEPEIPGPYRVAKKVPVQVGFTEADSSEVTEGLTLGDLVVTIGQETLKDGGRIRLPADPKLEDVKKDEAAEGEAD